MAFNFILFKFYIALLQLKKLRFIFIFIFLTGMMCTIFQYVPILEEEVAHNTELSKKGTEDDTSGSDGDETDSDSDDAINHYMNFNFTDLYSKTNSYTSSTDDYSSFFQKINIPPPKA